MKWSQFALFFCVPYTFYSTIQMARAKSANDLHKMMKYVRNGSAVSFGTLGLFFFAVSRHIKLE